MDVHGYTDQLLSSPEGSPSYYSYPEAGLTCHQSPRDSLPAAIDQTFDQAAFGVLRADTPPSSLPLTYDFQACASDARLVPDCLSVPDMSESPLDCALHQEDFSLQQPQGGSPVQGQHVPHHVMLTPNQSPTPPESDQYNEREQAEISILAQQISSLASSFSRYHSLKTLQNVAQPATTSTLPSACEWPRHPSLLPPKPELVLDDVTFDSILKDLDLVPGKSSLSGPGAGPDSYQPSLLRGSPQLEQEPLDLSPTTTEDLLLVEQLTVMEAFSLQLDHHDHNTGLHQLNHYMQDSLQQGNSSQTLQPMI